MLRGKDPQSSGVRTFTSLCWISLTLPFPYLGSSAVRCVVVMANPFDTQTPPKSCAGSTF